MSMRRPYPAYNGQGKTMSASQTHEMIERENDELVQTLGLKVAALKKVSIDIGDEVKSQNRSLGDMSGEFETTGSLLTGSMKRLKGMASAGHNRWMCYMILFIVIVFFVTYYIVRWRSS